jgi:hypothetical protein
MTTLRRHGTVVIALVTLVVAGAVAWLRLGVLLDAQRPVAHAHRVLAEVARLGVLANQADRAQRAYLAGQDPAAYRLYRDDANELDTTLGSVRALTGGDPVHQRIVAQIQQAAGPTGAVLADERYGRVTALVGAMQDHEATVLDRRLHDGSASILDARLLIAGILGAGALVVTVFWWGTSAAAARAASGAAAAGRADVERELSSLPAVTPTAGYSEEDVRGALAGAG